MTYEYRGTVYNDNFDYRGVDNLSADGSWGNDFIWGNTGSDTIYGGIGMDTLKGWSGNDYIYGEDDNDTLYGEDGNDYLMGDAGNDIVYGGNGDDTLYGGVGRDYLTGDEGNDTLDGGDGDDYLADSWGHNQLTGDYGNDMLIAGAGADVLRGGKGSDTIMGGGGADTLTGMMYAEVNANEYDILDCGQDSSVDRVYLAQGDSVFYKGYGHAEVRNFNYVNDYLYLEGNASMYRTTVGNFAYGPNGQNGIADTAIITTTGDYIAFIVDTTNFNFTRDVIFI